MEDAFDADAEGQVLLRRDGAIATVTLNRPERRNALSLAANRRLHALWGEIDADPGIRAVVLTSADCGTFCAGMDLKEAAALRATTGKDILDLLEDPFYERMRAVRVPVIAAMTGHFTAGGMVLASNADLRVGLAGTAGAITEARVGRGTPWAAPMVPMLPLAVLMEMAVTAQMMPVERLYALGFVNAVEATPDAVRAKAAAYALAIAANAPLSVAAAKAGLAASVDLGAHAGYALSKVRHREVYASADAIEGPLAFAEKRPPRWLGR
ncbi:enoyl-CoA hydratase/isomerase family protein [Achromobacter aloeverae]|uniref:Enoyl-CoA hydratase n=1 Tax=Achromobacter aloeverae TaxID=1750518 RepID=A0A4Q1HMM9_9BURK|nr:enoyl-CoA hydratase/isomerase family protein [Achromobacter aloeverae]RXN92232.1 enoyl-CoA hydratase [Achromobacter aloeverae]